MIFVDTYKRKYNAKIHPLWKKHSYDFQKLKKKGKLLHYEDEVYETKLGIDVSHHQKKINFVYAQSGKKKIGRNSKLTGNQTTENALAFCNRIQKEGYEATVYMDLQWQALQYDMKKLEDFPSWYVDYEKKPQTPYTFTFWQYSSKGKKNGISSESVELNLWFVKKKGK